jgi:hypothetical protein
MVKNRIHHHHHSNVSTSPERLPSAPEVSSMVDHRLDTLLIQTATLDETISKEEIKRHYNDYSVYKFCDTKIHNHTKKQKPQQQLHQQQQQQQQQQQHQQCRKHSMPYIAVLKKPMRLLCAQCLNESCQETKEQAMNGEMWHQYGLMTSKNMMTTIVSAQEVLKDFNLNRDDVTANLHQCEAAIHEYYNQQIINIEVARRQALNLMIQKQNQYTNSVHKLQQHIQTDDQRQKQWNTIRTESEFLGVFSDERRCSKVRSQHQKQLSFKPFTSLHLSLFKHLYEEQKVYDIVTGKDRIIHELKDVAFIRGRLQFQTPWFLTHVSIKNIQGWSIGLNSFTLNGLTSQQQEERVECIVMLQLQSSVDQKQFGHFNEILWPVTYNARLNQWRFNVSLKDCKHYSSLEKLTITLTAKIRVNGNIHSIKNSPMILPYRDIMRWSDSTSLTDCNRESLGFTVSNDGYTICKVSRNGWGSYIDGTIPVEQFKISLLKPVDNLCDVMVGFHSLTSGISYLQHMATQAISVGHIDGMIHHSSTNPHSQRLTTLGCCLKLQSSNDEEECRSQWMIIFSNNLHIKTQGETDLIPRCLVRLTGESVRIIEVNHQVIQEFDYLSSSSSSSPLALVTEHESRISNHITS